MILWVGWGGETKEIPKNQEPKKYVLEYLFFAPVEKDNLLSVWLQNSA